MNRTATKIAKIVDPDLALPWPGQGCTASRRWPGLKAKDYSPIPDSWLHTLTPMHRFFLSPELLSGETIAFPSGIARQIALVLRLKPAAHVIVLDGQGSEFEVELLAVGQEGVHGRIIAPRPARGEPRASITLYLALTGREKFEWMLQKCTEVGAAAFVPVMTSRSLVQDGQQSASKLERWARIVREAAEQSQRGIVPPLHAPLRFENALQQAKAHPLRLILWEREHTSALREALAPLKDMPAPTLAVFTGPEGGFSEREIEAARQAGFQPVTLGKRILRMETAAVVAAALILYELE
ncbi:MAG TPA: 16S rRNA (uracil(1498)-N(3))-methyltransferase [Levilinea sp.]|nr:16S rRNA (uracil(1498)-N(3))-methyltransferase [Levilinea sp.]